LASIPGNFLRRLALPKPVQHWSLTTLREKLIKIGAKVTRHSKYVTFQLAEAAVTRNLFAAILNRIARVGAAAAGGCWADAGVAASTWRKEARFGGCSALNRRWSQPKGFGRLDSSVENPEIEAAEVKMRNNCHALDKGRA
jgi:hypothetical protein